MAEITLRFDAHTRNAFETPVRVRVYDRTAVQVDFQDGTLGEEFRFQIKSAGLYRFRAELPSGELLDESVRLENDYSKKYVELESEDRSPSETLAWAYTQQNLGPTPPRDKPNPSIFESVFRPSPPRPLIVNEESVLAFANDSLYNVLARLRGVTRVRGITRVRGALPFNAFRMLQMIGLQIDIRATMDELPKSDNRLRARVTFNTDAIRIQRNSPQPNVACVVYTASNAFGQQTGCVLVPGAGGQVEVVFVARNNGEDEIGGSSAASLTRAVVRTGNGRGDALLAYLNKGSVRAARAAGNPLVAQANDLLYGKVDDPLSAVIAGYFLLQANAADERPNWLRNLADWFPGMPDGAVIYGSYCLRENRMDEAAEYLTRAVAQGVPAYTIGLRLLVDGLRHLSALDPKNEALQAAIEKVNLVAAYADWESQTTAFLL